jgi:hypothetical protein
MLLFSVGWLEDGEIGVTVIKPLCSMWRPRKQNVQIVLQSKTKIKVSEGERYRRRVEI